MDKNVCIHVSELLQLRNGALQCLELTFRPTLLEAKMKLAAWAQYISSWNKVEAYHSRLSELYWAWYLFLRSSTLTMLSIALLVQIHFVHKLLIYKRCNSKSYHKKRFSTLASSSNFMSPSYKLKLKVIQILIFWVLLSFMSVKCWRNVFYKEERCIVRNWTTAPHKLNHTTWITWFEIKYQGGWGLEGMILDLQVNVLARNYKHWSTQYLYLFLDFVI